MTTPGAPKILPCPSCRTDFVVGVQKCGACGVALTGPAAVDLWRIDQELERLQSRRAAALERLRAVGRPGAPAAASAGLDDAYASAETVRVPLPPGGGPASTGVARPAAAGATGQQLLLGAGVLLLVIAAVVFVAVAWDLLGVYGRLGALAIAIGACAALASFCAPRRLAASAEAFAVLSMGLAVVGLSAAYALDLFGAGELSVQIYLAVAAAMLAGLAAAFHPTARPLMTYPAVALVAGWVACVAVFADDSVIGWAVGFVVGWLFLASPFVRWARSVLDPTDSLLGPVAPVWREHGASGRSVWAPLWPVGLISGIGGVGLATGIIGSARYDAATLTVAAVLVVLGLAVTGSSIGFHRRFTDLPRPLVVPSIAVWLVLGVEVAALVRNIGVVADIVLVAVSIVVLLFLLCVRSPRTQGWSPHLGTAAVGAGVAGATLVVLDGGTGASAFVLALVAAGATALAVAEPPWRVRAEVIALATGIASVSFALVSIDATSTASTVVFAACGVALAVLAAARSRFAPDEEGVLAVGAVLVIGIAITVAYAAAADPDSSAGNDISTAGLVLTGAFVVAAATAFGYALVPGRKPVALLGLPLAIAAAWTPMVDAGIDTLEAYTLSAAVLCALYGVLVQAMYPRAGSWVTWGPALGFALVPSAVLAMGGSDARLAYVLLAGAPLMVLGVALRSQATVAIAGASLVVVAIPQLFLIAADLPPTLSFTIAGLLLVAAGVRYERNVRDLRTVGVWFDRMN